LACKFNSDFWNKYSISPIAQYFYDALVKNWGWRAFMTPRLLKLFNPKAAFLIGGAIWALWHGVGILLGLNYPRTSNIRKYYDDCNEYSSWHNISIFLFQK